MTLTEVENFLKNKGGFLVNYRVKNDKDEIMSAAEIIYDRAQANKINPKFVLVLLQKEMGLVEDKSPTKRQLDWACGYGCPDGGRCNSRWEGFWKQINSATLQFYDYLENPESYKFQKGRTYTFTNSYSTTKKETTIVTPANNGTAALYNYTPHVYNGNYNFYKLWQRYFTKSYPNGSLLQARGEVGVWLIQKGQKRPFTSKSALTSRFDINKIISVNKADLDKYDRGTPIKFPNYSIVRSPMGTRYLLVDNKRRKFINDKAFQNLGYNPEEILNANLEDILSYIEGVDITETSVYPTGALLQNNKTGGVYWIEGDTKSPLLDRAFLTTIFKRKKIIAISPEKLEKYKLIDPVMFKNGELLTSPRTKAVYLLENGKRRPFMSGTMFEKLGYKWINIITVNHNLLEKYPMGEAIKENNF